MEMADSDLVAGADVEIRQRQPAAARELPRAELEQRTPAEGARQGVVLGVSSFSVQ